MSSDHRRRTRVLGAFEGLLRLGVRSLPITTHDISLKGLLCRTPARNPELTAGESGEVDIHLAPDVTITVEAAIARVQDDEIAVDFLSMDDESYSHLRNLVRYSAEDPDAIDAEQLKVPFVE